MGVLEAVQVSDPAYAIEKRIDDELVDKLARLPVLHPMLADLKLEAAAYMRCADGVRVDRTDIDEFTKTEYSASGVVVSVSCRAGPKLHASSLAWR